MSNEATGFTCPECGSYARQKILRLRAGLDVYLLCMACEARWTEDLTNG